MEKNKPFQIGITGGIGTGKSIICRIFKHLSIPVYDADSRAKWLLANDPELKQQIIAVFGQSSYNADGGVNRAYLASQVFNQSDRVEELNSIIHPAVRKNYADWIKENAFYPYVLKEAALLFESGSYKSLDKIITVTAPEDIRIKRVMARDPQRSPEEIKSIISKQLSEDEKVQRADYIIFNDESRSVIRQVLDLHHLLLHL